MKMFGLIVVDIFEMFVNFRRCIIDNIINLILEHKKEKKRILKYHN